MTVQSDGCTKKQHLESVQKQIGRELEELKVPPLPKSCSEVWKWFLNLNSARQASMSALPISFSDMRSYFELIQVVPNEDEISILRMLDNIALDVISKQKPVDKKTK